MALFITQTFQKNFLRLPEDTRPKIEIALRSIYSNPPMGKKLLGDLGGEYSLRVGVYRIIYFIDEKNDIWVETVRHRKDIYKKRVG